MAAAKRPPWFEVASAVPLVATEWLDLGPFARSGRPKGSALSSLTPATRSPLTAADAAGATGVRVLEVLLWYGGSVTGATLAAESPGSDPDDLADAIARLTAAELVEPGSAGGLRLHPSVASVLEPRGGSLELPQVVTSDVLGRILKVLGITPAPTRKQDRIDAIADLFADPEGRVRVMGSLSERARTLFERIADRAGPEVVDPMSVGLDAYSLRRVQVPQLAYGNRPHVVPEEVAPVAELTTHGIVGMAPWDDVLWIWREAWVLLDRPLHRHWPSADWA